MIKQLENEFGEEIENLKKQYCPKDLTDKEFKILVEEELKKFLKKYNPDSNSKNKFKRNLKEKIKMYLANQQEYYEYLTFIIEQFIDKHQTELIEKQLLLLDQFLTKMKFEADEKTCNELLTKSLKLQNIITQYLCIESSKSIPFTEKNFSKSITYIIKIFCDNYKKRYNDVKEELLELYGIKASSPLTLDEEKELFAKIKDNDKMAKQTIFEKTEWLVIEIAKQYVSHNNELMDLIQEGNVALLEAIEAFSKKNEQRFYLFSGKYIKNSIIKSLNKNTSIINCDYETIEAYQKMQDITKRFGQNLIVTDLSALLIYPEEKIEELKNSTEKTISFEEFLSKNKLTDINTNYFKQTDQSLNYIELKRDIQFLLNASNLTENEYEVLRLKFGIGTSKLLTLKEISEILNYSKSRINQVERKVLTKIKRNKYVKNLDEYLTI